MADVKRYSLYVGEDYNSRMVEMKYGAYVEYDDYKALEAKYNALVDKVDLWRKENAHLRQELAHYKQIAELATEGLADAVRRGG